MTRIWALAGTQMERHFESLQLEPGTDPHHPGRIEANEWGMLNGSFYRDMIVTAMLQRLLCKLGTYDGE